MRRFRLFALTLAVGTLATGCSSGGSVSSSAGPQATPDNPLNHPIGGTVTIDNESGTLWTCGFNPLNAATQFISIGEIYEPLYYVSSLNKGAETPLLAKSYAWSNNNTTLTFDIRSGVQWNDGTPFTADDVVYTFNLLKATSALDIAGVWSVLASVAKQGDSQVVFTFQGPNVPSFYNVAVITPIVPQHIWSKIADPVNELDPSPVGTGPFMIAAGGCTPQNIEYSRNPNYWQQGLPRIQKVEFPAFLSNDAANNFLDAGKAQWGSQYIPNIDSVYTNKGPNRHWWFPAIVNNALFANLTKAPLNDVKLRQAIAYAIDRNKVAKIGETGYEPAENQTGIVLPTFKDWYDQNLATQDKYNYTYNASKANSLLDAAGYTKGSDGIRVDPKTGNKLSFQVIVNSGYGDFIASLQVVESELADIGIELKTNPLAQTDLVNAYTTGSYDFTYTAQTGGPTPYYELRQWLLASNSAAVGQPAATNWERFTPDTVGPDSAAVDKLLTDYGAAVDSASQHKIISQIEEYVLKDVPFIPITAAVDWYQWDTTKIGGWPTPDNPYAQPISSTFPDQEIIMLHLYQK